MAAAISPANYEHDSGGLARRVAAASANLCLISLILEAGRPDVKSMVQKFKIQKAIELCQAVCHSITPATLTVACIVLGAPH